MSKKLYDFAIIGEGALGMNIARKLLTHMKGSKIVLLDKHHEIYENPAYDITGSINFNKNNLKAELYSQSNKLKDFCNENNLKYFRRDQVIVTTNASDEDLVKKNNIAKATYEQIYEPLSLDKAKSKQFYINENAGLVDSNEIKSFLNNSIQDENIDHKKKVNIDKISKNNGTYKITTIKKSEIETKFIINVSGLDALKYANQIHQYDYKQFNYTYTYYKLPNQLNFNKIYSSVPYIIHPGVNMYKDYDDFPVLGPIIHLSVKQEGFFSKLKSLREYYKFLPILVDNENYQMNICYNHPYKAKMIFQPYLNIYYVIGTEKVHKQEIKSVLIKNKKIVEDIIIESQDNAIHLLNNNMEDNEMSLFLPITDNIIKLIK